MPDESIYVPVSSFDSAGVHPSHGMGLTMEGKGHTLRHVGDSFMSRHHKARCMEETSYNTQHALYITHTPLNRGEGKIMVMCVCVDIAPGVYLGALHVLMVCSLCYIVVPTTVRNWYMHIDDI